jgi:hypothetical protein
VLQQFWANERSSVVRALFLTVEQADESIFGPVGIVNLAKRGQLIGVKYFFIWGQLFFPFD